MTSRAYKENYALIDWSKEIVIDRKKVAPAQRADLPCPYVASDVMEPTQHPCTGEYLTSKAQFRKITKAHGCVEIGNDPARLRPKPKPVPDRKAIRQSLKKAQEIVASR